MKYLVMAAMAALTAVPASAASLIDYDVYAAGNAFISGGSYGDIASGSFTNANGAGGNNFASRVASTSDLTASARTFSNQFAAMTPTGTVQPSQWNQGDVTLTGSTNGTNVFNITGAQWSQLYKLSFAGLGNGAIVNVIGDGAYSNYVDLQFGNNLLAENVVFNFQNATELTMGGWNVRGTVLAPDAFLTIRGGSVAGAAIAKNFHSEGTTIGGKGFSGFAANQNAVPEPATWAMMLFGFGAMGMMMRRRAPRTSLRIRFA